MKRLALLALTGCAKILGLDDTKLDKQDAAIDAPSVCDGAPQCSSLTGRSICGQLVQTGAMAGIPLRVAAPTGLACQAGNTEGPCGFKVTALPKTSFLTASVAGKADGVIDDCGRYAVIDFDQTQADVAVEANGDAATFKRTATLLLGRTTLGGPNNVDKGVDIYVVSKATATEWAQQVMGSGTPPDTATGYLLHYTRMGGSQEGVQAAKDGSNGFTSAPGTVPWAAYFGGTSGFGALDPTLTATGKAGTAFAVFGGGTFNLQGVTSGRRCPSTASPISVNQVDNALISVTVPNC